ncbi:MAG: hypothetical protein O3B13_07490 [Planctomycetota bacterium]|nr:hypothetical protein [Planctomycetota bacterium]MDA1162928.1 hypothetical protein [Planctomycetota bacterium]
MPRSLFTIAILAFSLALPSVARSQANVPADIGAPAADTGDPNRPDIPTRLDAVVLPEVQFLFDGLLDPDRISLIESVTSANLDDVRLTTAARSLIRNHLIAMQQVELAIQFLQANRDSILSGNNANFNSIFGNPGSLREVAVVNTTPLSGMATVRTSMTAGLIELMFRDNDIPNLPAQLKVGDFVFVGDAPNNDPDGFILEVEQIMFDVDGSNQSAMGTSTFGGALTRRNRGMVPVYKVLTFEQRTDPARFERVVQTFTAIRDSLQGLDVNLAPNLQTQNTITYQRDFEDINNIWAPGIAPFTSLDDVVRRELDRTGLTSTRTADRLVRQAGFSNSDSHQHIDRLDDQGLAQTVDYQRNATFPLLWTEDNQIPLNLGANSPVAGATDEDRAFFNNRQTIFGEPDNPFMQYIGRAFLEETIFHDGEFFDDTLAVVDQDIVSTFIRQITQNGQTITTVQTLTDALQLAEVRATRPIRGPGADLDGNPQTQDFDIRQVPESGDPIIAQTELRKWQMIIESFAEHSTDLDLFNVAAVGIAQMFGDFAPDDLRARDAGNYAKFAALIGNSSALGSIDVTRIEPFGKRATAGFSPVVPRN